MNHTKVPRSLIYRERRSLEEFGAYETESITRPLADVMLRLDFINSEERALWCLNTAFYICTMIMLEVDPRWRIEDYKRIAIPQWNYKSEDFQILTLSMVGLLLSRLEEPDPLLSNKGKTRSHLIWLMIDGGEFNPIFNELYKQINKDPFITPTIPNSTFAPRVIDKETIHDVMSDLNFNWVKFTNYLEERSVRDIVKVYGYTEEEKHNLVDMMRQASHGFYLSSCNDQPKLVDAMLSIIDNEIHKQFNPEDNSALIETENKTDFYKQRVEELEAENTKLHAEIEQMKNCNNLDVMPIEPNENLQKEMKEMIIEMLKPIFKDSADAAIEFLDMINGKADMSISNIVYQWVKQKKISERSKGRPLWRVLHAAKLYRATEQNWNTALRNHP